MENAAVFSMKKKQRVNTCLIANCSVKGFARKEAYTTKESFQWKAKARQYQKVIAPIDAQTQNYQSQVYFLCNNKWSTRIQQEELY